MPAPATFPPSWYHLNAPKAPQFAPLNGKIKADVCIVGGGFAGLSAALHLAEAGTDVVVLEAGSLGYGASGRNGGQMHSGQRRDVSWLEDKVGHEAARQFWQIGENAKDHINWLASRTSHDLQFRPGLIHSAHSKALAEEAAEEANALASRHDYTDITVLGRDEICTALGSERYAGGLRDAGAGHLNPYHLVLALIELGEQAGVRFFEQSPAHRLDETAQRTVVTPAGQVAADTILVTTNGRSDQFETATRQRTIGINSFIAVTEPLGSVGDTIFPGGECADDSFFVVRYWRKTPDNRLLLGGGECHAGRIPKDIAEFVRPHIEDIYPQLKDFPIAHAWGGVVSITAPRLPFVRTLAPGVLTAGGFSGQGVALAPYMGKVLAAETLSDSGMSDEYALYHGLDIAKLPSSTLLRRAMITMAIWHGRLTDRFS